VAFLDTLRIGVDVSVGTILAQTGTVVFSNSNSVTFGMQSSWITSVYSVITASQSGVTAAIQSISAGTTQITSGQVVFSNSGGFSFGVNGQTVTAQLSIMKYWENQVAGAYWGISVPWSSTNPNLSLQRISFGYPMNATRADLLIALITANTTATALSVPTGTYTISLGVYTLSRSTASLASSGTVSVSWASGTTTSAASIFGGQSGSRFRSVPLGTWNITPGEYLLGFMASLSAPAGVTLGFRVSGSQCGQTWSFSQAPNQNAQYFGNGYYSTGTPSLPSSVQLSDFMMSRSVTFIEKWGQPYVQIAGTF
jgi:hypothetical protein